MAQMRAPDVSVIIPTCNRGTLVARAVESALAAIRPADEVLVVDDGSTDDTAARLAPYLDRIRYLPSRHVGPGAIRNLGIREARGALVAFLDSDDEWMPDKLELQRTVMERRPEALFCFSDFGHRSGPGAEIRRYLSRWHRDRRAWSEILGPGVPFSSLAPLPPGRGDFTVHVGDLYLTEMLGDYVCTSTVVVRRLEAGRALRFAEDLYRYQDWECFGRLAGAGLAAYLDTETQWNCDHPGARLTHADELYCATARVTILERVWGSDPRFLARHGARYREVLAGHRKARAHALLVRGRTREAREGFREAGSSSIAERALAALPGPLARALVTARRRLWLDTQWPLRRKRPA
jgi:glycosyltransferase involved in cell wall biosynthesis